MNKIQKLINELCPNGVELKRIEEVVVWNKKFKDANNTFKPVKIPDILSKVAKEIATNDGDIKILTTGLKDLYTIREGNENYIYNGEVITIPTGGSANIKYHNGDFINCGNIIGISQDKKVLNTKYLYYFLIENQELIESFYRGSAIKHPSMSDILSIEIPIPPLKIQDEIVRVLDSFSELTAELTAELNLRSSQYIYYRDKLLNFDNNNQEIKIKRLDEISNILVGKDKPEDFSTEQSKTHNYPVISNGKGQNAILGYSSTFAVNSECITISARGTIGYCEYRNYPFTPVIRLLTLLPNDNVDTKFLYHYLSRYFSEKTYDVGGIQQLTKVDIQDIKIHCPCLSIQSKISNFLDNFEQICTDLNIGLPKEAELRNKQYEYYRDQIFNYLNTGKVEDSREREI
ncbi:restriction endonuclease subunit S [Mycoplasma tullyi]|uniref:Restriction endonuclease subunit S n=1 Tax=Mycoplasma tullyi TaxID=1612150 RepID=A0A7D7U8B1_9MOLU|nr:restriction endonuclease subunit S [Mycoplasma tullyi]QMT98808.1 restriction endonuclease subunit S [Mycoplasma tullyi]